jgi:glycine oxidase
MTSCLILGAGVIGLSLAWELAKRGWQVRVIDRGEPGREASWAGAGIIAPHMRSQARHPLEQLQGLSCELHPHWAAELKALTGIDNGYRVCGGLYLARTAGESASLAAWAQHEREEGVSVEKLTRDEVAELEPQLNADSRSLRAVYLLPEEAQLRNPRHLQALLAAVKLAGVVVEGQVEARGFAIHGGELTGVVTSRGVLSADRYCVTAGAWTQQLLAQLGVSTGILPIRGQMVLFDCGRRIVQRIINEGSRYLVPRDDGRLLAGATEEEVGFDKRTTEEAIADLTSFACGLVPALGACRIEQAWAGLRPASFDGLPYLGPLPGLSNAFVAAGHFRSGLALSPGTAVVMGQLMAGERTAIDLAPFRVGR